MERNTSYDDKLQEFERALRDNVLRRLPGDDKAIETAEAELSNILTGVLIERRPPPDNPVPAIHPSSLGGCRRLQYYTLIGCKREPPTSRRNFDKEAIERMKASSGMHNVIQEAVARLPQQILKVENEVWIPEDSEAATLYDLRGKCDTLIYDLSSGEMRPWLVLEYKFIGSGQFATLNAPDRKHLKQATGYMFAFSVPITALIYFNKENMRKKVYIHIFDTEIWKEVSEEIKFIQEAVKNKEIPNREPNFYVCRNICNYLYECKPPMRSRLA